MFGPICISQNRVLGKTFPFRVFNFFQFWLKFKSICFRSVALLCCSLHLKMNLHCPCNWTRYLCKFAFAQLQFTLLHCRTLSGYTMFEFAAECYCNLQNAFRSSNVEEQIIFYSGGRQRTKTVACIFWPLLHTLFAPSRSQLCKNAFCQLSMSTLSLEQAGGNVYFDLFKCGRISQIRISEVGMKYIEWATLCSVGADPQLYLHEILKDFLLPHFNPGLNPQFQLSIFASTLTQFSADCKTCQEKCSWVASSSNQRECISQIRPTIPLFHIKILSALSILHSLLHLVYFFTPTQPLVGMAFSCFHLWSTLPSNKR